MVNRFEQISDEARQAATAEQDLAAKWDAHVEACAMDPNGTNPATFLKQDDLLQMTEFVNFLKSRNAWKNPHTKMATSINVARSSLFKGGVVYDSTVLWSGYGMAIGRVTIPLGRYDRYNEYLQIYVCDDGNLRSDVPRKIANVNGVGSLPVAVDGSNVKFGNYRMGGYDTPQSFKEKSLVDVLTDRAKHLLL